MATALRRTRDRLDDRPDDRLGRDEREPAGGPRVGADRGEGEPLGFAPAPVLAQRMLGPERRLLRANHPRELPIDGRPVKFDPTRQMPVWGSDFRHEALANVKTTAAPESYVAAEIASILEYLKSIQVK